MSWDCSDASADVLTILPERMCTNSLDLASVEFTETLLDGEEVLIDASKLWRECYVTVKMYEYHVLLAWHSTNGGNGFMRFRRDEAWSDLLNIWASKWPKGIPSFVSLTPASECAPAYCEPADKVENAAENDAENASQPTEFYRCPKAINVSREGHIFVEVVVGDEIGLAYTPIVFEPGRLRIKEGDAGVEFVLRRADGSQVAFYLATAGIGRAEIQQALTAWDTHDIGVVYQDDSGIPRVLPSPSRIVSKDELPLDRIGRALDEGTRNGSQIFILAEEVWKESCVNVCIRQGCLTLSLQRTNWDREVLHIPVEDEALVKTLEKFIDDKDYSQHYASIKEMSPELVSKCLWTSKLAKDRVSRAQAAASQIATPQDHNSIGILSGTLLERKGGDEDHYIDEDHLYTKVHVKFKDKKGQWQMDLTFPNGGMETILFRNRQTHFKVEDFLPCWSAAYPDGTDGFFVRRKRREWRDKGVPMYFEWWE